MSDRDKYIEAMKARLDEWNREIDRLESRIKQARTTIADEVQTRLSEARQMQEKARLKLEEIRTSEEPWESLKDELDHVWKVLKQSANYFRSQI